MWPCSDGSSKMPLRSGPVVGAAPPVPDLFADDGRILLVACEAAVFGVSGCDML